MHGQANLSKPHVASVHRETRGNDRRPGGPGARSRHRKLWQLGWAARRSLGGARDHCRGQGASPWGAVGNPPQLAETRARAQPPPHARHRGRLWPALRERAHACIRSAGPQGPSRGRLAEPCPPHDRSPAASPTLPWPSWISSSMLYLSMAARQARLRHSQGGEEGRQEGGKGWETEGGLAGAPASPPSAGSRPCVSKGSKAELWLMVGSWDQPAWPPSPRSSPLRLPCPSPAVPIPSGPKTGPSSTHPLRPAQCRPPRSPPWADRTSRGPDFGVLLRALSPPAASPSKRQI